MWGNTLDLSESAAVLSLAVGERNARQSIFGEMACLLLVGEESRNPTHFSGPTNLGLNSESSKSLLLAGRGCWGVGKFMKTQCREQFLDVSHIQRGQ